MRKSALLLIFAVLLVLSSVNFASAWYGDYPYRYNISGSNLDINVPFVFNGSNCINIEGNKQCIWLPYKGAGTALYFYNYTNYTFANDTTQLPMEVEFGNATDYNPTSVWDANYILVQHMNDNSTSTTLDSTSKNNDGIKTGANSPLESDGKFGKSQYFDHSNYLNVAGLTGEPTASFTIETWMNATSAEGGAYGIFGYGGAGDGIQWLIGYPAGPKTHNLYIAPTASNLIQNTWLSIAVTRTVDTVQPYTSGVVDGSAVAAGAKHVFGVDTYYIGMYDAANGFLGFVDEFRISNVSRSASFINQTYQNAIGTSGYGMAGVLEEKPTPPSGEAPVVTAHATSPAIVYPNTDLKFNMTATDSDNATINGYVQFYVNGAASGSAQSQAMNNNTNTLIRTLSHSSFSVGNTLIAEYWVSDGINTTAKANHSTVTVQSGAPNLPVLVNPANNSLSGVNAVNLSVNVTDNQGDAMNVSFYNENEDDIGNRTTYSIAYDVIVSNFENANDQDWTTQAEFKRNPGYSINPKGNVYEDYILSQSGGLFNYTFKSAVDSGVSVYLYFWNRSSNSWEQQWTDVDYGTLNITKQIHDNYIDDSNLNFSVKIYFEGYTTSAIFQFYEGKIFFDNYIGNATNIANGSTATYQWTNLADGVSNWYATVTDGYETNTSVVWTFSIDTTAPTYSNVGMNDTNVQINDTVLFYALWTDAVGDLNYSIFSWNKTGSWVNDSAVALTAWSNTTKTINSAKVEVDWKIYANDSLGHWNNTGTQNFSIADTAPTDPTDISGFPANLYVTDILTLTASGGTDADNDTIIYHYKFYDVNESAIRQDWSATNTYTIVVADAHDTIRVYAKSTTTDANSSGNYNETDFVDDTIPTDPTDLTLTAGDVKVTDTLTGTCTDSTDADGDTITYYYQFYNTNNTAERQAYSSDNTYVIAVVDAHDEIRVRCKATTNYGESAGYDEVSKQIADTLPTTPTGSSLTAGDVKVTDTLTGTGAGSTDADSDAITYHYQFYNTNDTTERQAKSSDSTYVIAVADAHDNIRVRIWATTTYGDSVAYEDENKQIANTAPTQPTLTHPANNNINNTLTMNWTASTDADSDTINYYIIMNGTVVCYTAGLNCSYDPIDSYYQWNVSAFDGIANTTSTSRYFTYDTVSPTITLNPNNAFTTTNTSTINNYNSTSFPLNITFADERDLFAIEINITNSTGYVMFNYTNTTSISGLSYNYTNTLNNTAWAKGLYTINITASDSHTSMLIGDYGLIKQADMLVFETPEANRITIEADEAISSGTIKKGDRYQFEFSYPKTKTTDVVYHIESDNEIYYRPDSGYKAHFVIWNPRTKSGNWVDFEDIALKDYTVQKVDDKHYTITFKMPAEGIEIIKFNSIGGLNVVTKTYSWYRGSTSQSYTTPVLTNTTTCFYLNVTNTSTMSDINARFFYNYTEYSVTKTTSVDYGFSAAISTPTIATGTQNFNFTWNISINQTDGTQYNFSELKNQTVSTAQINITIRDEIGLYLINNETFDVYLLNEGRYYTTSIGYLLVGNLSPSIPYIEIENTNYPRRGFYVTISENLTTELTAYLLRSSPTTQEVIFIVQSSDLSKIGGAKLTFYRMINMTYVTVGQVITDYAGQTALTLDTMNQYNIVIEAAGYPIKTIGLRPIQSSYTITLQETGAGFENVFEGIAYTITPINRTFNVSQNYTNFRLDIYSSNSDLEYFGVRVFDHSYICVPASCVTNVTGSPAGGSAIVQVIGNTTGTAKVDVFYKRVDYDLMYLNYNIYSFVEMLKANIRSMWNLRNQYLGRFSPIMLALIAIIGTIILLGTAAEIGIYGLPLIVIAAFGLIFFAVIGFLNPLIVGLSLILGGVVYFRFSGGGD